MRIAFSGSHRTGKTTLVEALADRLPRYRTHEEPYRLLEEDGVELSDPPSADDYELQLVRSLELLTDDRGDVVLYDRCPVDFLAYIEAIDASLTDVTALLDEHGDAIDEAMSTLDLVVFVGVEEPDVVALPSFEDQRLRADVDSALRRLLLDEPRFQGAVVEVHGSVATRVEQVLTAMAARQER